VVGEVREVREGGGGLRVIGKKGLRPSLATSKLETELLSKLKRVGSNLKEGKLKCKIVLPE
jgi:hypothetical protein